MADDPFPIIVLIQVSSPPQGPLINLLLNPFKKGLDSHLTYDFKVLFTSYQTYCVKGPIMLSIHGIYLCRYGFLSPSVLDLIKVLLLQRSHFLYAFTKYPYYSLMTRFQCGSGFPGDPASFFKDCS